MFSILNDWKINHSRSRKYKCQCCINPTKNIATIFPWDDNTEEPRDYLLHEHLHVALRALNRMDRRKPKEYLQAEETLIQEICRLKL